jgi:hypothetical protein
MATRHIKRLQEQLGAKQEPAVEPDTDEESEEEEPAAAPKFNPFDLLSDDEVQLRWMVYLDGGCVLCTAPQQRCRPSRQQQPPNRRCACMMRLAVVRQPRQHINGVPCLPVC